MGCGEVTSGTEVAKLSVAGIGMRSHTGVAIRIFRVLSTAGINIEMVNTSEVRVNIVVAGTCGEEGSPVPAGCIRRCTCTLSVCNRYSPSTLLAQYATRPVHR